MKKIKAPICYFLSLWPTGRRLLTPYSISPSPHACKVKGCLGQTACSTITRLLDRSLSLSWQNFFLKLCYNNSIQICIYISIHTYMQMCMYLYFSFLEERVMQVPLCITFQRKMVTYIVLTDKTAFLFFRDNSRIGSPKKTPMGADTANLDY